MVPLSRSCGSHLLLGERPIERLGEVVAYGSAADAEDLANLLTRYRTAGLAWPVQYYLENRILSCQLGDAFSDHLLNLGYRFRHQVTEDGGIRFHKYCVPGVRS